MKKRVDALLLSMLLSVSLTCTVYADQTTSLNREGDRIKLEYTDPNPLPPPLGSVVEEEEEEEPEPVKEPAKEPEPAKEQEPAKKQVDEQAPAKEPEPVKQSVNNPFDDVQPDDYFYDAVLWAVEQKIIGGTGSFNPDTICTRAETVTILWRAAGSPQPANSTSPFTDVLPGDYYYNAVLWAVEQDITTGITTAAFSPDSTVDRAQVVTFLFRAMNAQSQSVAGDNPFTDVSADNYYYDTVLWAVENGIISGDSKDTFDPAEKCTRAHIVTFLYRAQNPS